MKQLHGETPAHNVYPCKLYTCMEEINEMFIMQIWCTNTSDQGH